MSLEEKDEHNTKGVGGARMYSSLFQYHAKETCH